jgi:GntR family transcriptional regulator/MocR family aminotransferase
VSDTLWVQLFVNTPGEGISLQARLRAAIIQAVLDHRLRPATALPSSRQLAAELGISRNTVTLAYHSLAEEGFVLARDRAQHIIHPEALQNAARPVPTPRPVPNRLPSWDTRLLSRPSLHRHVTKPADWFNYPFPFVYGQADPNLFPLTGWREAVKLAQRSSAVRSWAGDHVDADDPVLIEQLQKWVLPRRGIWVSPDQILVTVGAQQALYIAAALLLNRDRTVGVEQPSYPDIRNICRHFSPNLVALPMDEDGMQPSWRIADCDVLFIQPSHQNPTTRTMPLARRHEILAAAARHDIVIVEDDYDNELTFEGEAMPALKALDRDDRVIYVGSLSKTLAPGLRLGYLVGAAEFVTEARAMRRLVVRHPPLNNQRAVALFLQMGYYDAAVKRLIIAYRERAAAVCDALRKHVPQFRFQPPTGGAALWAEGPDTISMDAVARAGHKRGLLMDSGAIFFEDAAPPQHFGRLGYCSIGVDQIEPGIRLFAEIVRERSG